MVFGIRFEDAQMLHDAYIECFWMLLGKLVGNERLFVCKIINPPPPADQREFVR